MKENDFLISIKSLTKTFNGIVALDGIDISVKKGSIHGLIGPNGAGKTTFFNVITGLIPATKGKIFFKSVDITKYKPEQIAALGVSRTFQSGKLVPKMSVLENVMVGSYHNTKPDLIGSFLRLPFTNSRQEKQIKNRSLELLDLVGMSKSADRWTEDLVWVERQLVQFCRALAANPELLLLDEPTGGMGADESDRVSNIIRKLNKEHKMTIVVIGHDMKCVLSVSDEVTCINFGKKITDGLPTEVINNKDVMEAYLGKE